MTNKEKHVRRMSRIELWVFRRVEDLERLWDVLFGYRDLKKRYRATFGQDPDLRNPTLYGEKIQWRKINDRNPLFPILTDKITCREFYREILGEDQAEALLPAKIGVFSNAEDIPFEKLKNGAVIKSAHASGWNEIVKPGEILDESQIKAKCNNWLGKVFGTGMHEWAYRKVQRRLLIEKLLLDADGNRPMDFKIQYFDGKAFRITVIKHTDQDTFRASYTPDWMPIDLPFLGPGKTLVASAMTVDKPKKLKEMIELGAKVAAGMDHVRVDYLLADDQFWLGEMTLYSGSGFGYFHSDDYEKLLGDQWILPTENLRRKLFGSHN